jgi:hypothetical protein
MLSNFQIQRTLTERQKIFYSASNPPAQLPTAATAAVAAAPAQQSANSGGLPRVRELNSSSSSDDENNNGEEEMQKKKSTEKTANSPTRPLDTRPTAGKRQAEPEREQGQPQQQLQEQEQATTTMMHESRRQVIENKKRLFQFLQQAENAYALGRFNLSFELCEKAESLAPQVFDPQLDDHMYYSILAKLSAFCCCRQC